MVILINLNKVMTRQILKQKFVSTRQMNSIFNFYQILNLVLAVAFPVTKLINPLPRVLYDQQFIGFDTREREILIFLAVVIIWKNRKSTNYLHTLSIIYLFAKLANGALFFRALPIYGIMYSSVAIFAFVFIPEPLPSESSKVHYFKNGTELKEVLAEDKSIVWVICFFATWSDSCRYVAPVFSLLSEKYSLANLRFGKLDVGKNNKDSEHFCVNNHPTSRQLPTVAVFKSGVQLERRPLVENRRAINFVFTEENLILALELNDRFAECKRKIR